LKGRGGKKKTAGLATNTWSKGLAVHLLLASGEREGGGGKKRNLKRKKKGNAITWREKEG